MSAQIGTVAAFFIMKNRCYKILVQLLYLITVPSKQHSAKILKKKKKTET